MPTSPLEILRVAQNLAATATEAATRSAISRAYYAGLHSVAESFDERERLNDETSHGEIIGRVEAYKNQVPPQPGRAAAITILKAVTRLRRERNKADYNLGIAINTDDGANAVVRSRQILDLCQEVRDQRSKAAD